MDFFLISFKSTSDLVIRIGTVMFISLFGIEFLMQLGLMKYLKPFGKPIAKIANLPSESALSFIAAIGSMIAAHSITAGFYQDRKITEKELVLTGVLNTVPFHFKEIFTFQLPVVLPLLGPELSFIYIMAFVLTGIIKLFFVIIIGKLHLSEKELSDEIFNSYECDPDDKECTERTLKDILKDTWKVRKKMFMKMISVLFIVTFIIQILVNTGLLKWLERAVGPFTNLFGLPPSVAGPVTAYIFSPTVGITFMSNILKIGSVTPFQAITALLAGSLIMIPVSRIRRTLPRYTSIYGLKNGSVICGITTFLSMLSRVIILFAVFLLY